MTFNQMMDLLGWDFDIMKLEPNRLKSDLKLKRIVIQKQREIKLKQLTQK